MNSDVINKPSAPAKYSRVHYHVNVLLLNLCSKAIYYWVMKISFYWTVTNWKDVFSSRSLRGNSYFLLCFVFFFFSFLVYYFSEETCGWSACHIFWFKVLIFLMKTCTQKYVFYVMQQQSRGDKSRPIYMYFQIFFTW